MTTLQESSTPPTVGTDLSVTVLVGPATEIRVTDAHHPDRDLVAIYFDSDQFHAAVIGDLTTMQRWVDDAAHELMLVSTRRGTAEEAADDRTRGLAGVASLRDAAAHAREIGVNDVLEAQRNAVG